MKKFLWRKLLLSKQSLNKMSLLFIAAAMLWLKTYIVYKTSFDIKTNSIIDEIILLINPIGFVLIFLGFGLFFREKKFKKYVIGASIFISLLLFADLVYYREFTDYITVPLLMQTNNFDGMGSSIFALLSITDILLFIDIPILIYFVRRKPNISSFNKFAMTERILYFAMAAAILLINYGMASTQRTELLTRTFDREMLVKYLGTYNYHIYDIALQTKTSATRAMANSDQFVEIESYLKDKRQIKNLDLQGVAKGRNVIIVHMESLQSFVINNKVGEDEVTPFLNDFIGESFYFENFYHQVSQGKSSDAEFLQDTSLYPLDRGAVFFTHVNNKYLTLPNVVKESGYYPAVFHANNASFWNRDVMYKTLGYENYYAMEYYDINEDNSIGWGLKDKDFFEQSMKIIKELPQPFFTKFITLTNHYKFEIDEEDKLIPEYWSQDMTVNRYFTTVRYMDESIKHFIQRLKDEGLYDNSIIIMYGDHYGISENHKKAMAMYLDKEEITPMDSAQLQRVPLIIHIPGVTDKNPQILSTVGGQIDLKPTILNLLGLKDNKDLHFGTDLLAKNRDDLVVFRDGSFVTKDYVYTNGVCYDKLTGEEVDSALVEDYIAKSKLELYYSDQIIYGDLFRFYNNAVEVSN